VNNDWSGTAAAEDSLLTASGDLYKLAGLDSSQWSILGIDLHTFSHGEDPNWTVHVYALDRKAQEVDSHESLMALAEQRGSFPIKDILLHDVSLDDVVRCMKVISVQLLRRHVHALDIVERGDHPEQD
jgi:hypothetical protein